MLHSCTVQEHTNSTQNRMYTRQQQDHHHASRSTDRVQRVPSSSFNINTSHYYTQNPSKQPTGTVKLAGACAHTIREGSCATHPTTATTTATRHWVKIASPSSLKAAQTLGLICQAGRQGSSSLWPPPASSLALSRPCHTWAWDCREAPPISALLHTPHHNPRPDPEQPPASSQQHSHHH